MDGQSALTPRQSEALAAIKTYIETEGMPPTVRDLMRMMGLRSTSAAGHYFEHLKAKGYITTEERVARSVRIVEPGQPTHQTRKSVRPAR